MRLAIFLFLLLFPSLQTRGQASPLFVIVSCSEGVVLDGKKVSPGQVVYSNSKQLIIPKKGYVGVITNEGFAFELTRSFRAKNLAGNQDKKISEFWLNWIKLFDPVHSDPSEIQIIGAPENQYAKNYGDSILISIIDAKDFDPPYVLEYRDMNDRMVFQESLSENWKVKEIRKLIESYEVIVLTPKHSTSKRLSGTYLLRLPVAKDKEKLQFDFLRIPKNTLDESIFKLVIFELNHFYYDHLFLLYQLERSNYQPQDKIFSTYIAQQKKEIPL